MADINLTTAQIAQCLGKTKQAVMKRADKENWPFQNGKGKGGSLRKYPLSSLPGEIQKAYIKENGASRRLLPALKPEAALAAIDEFLPVPTFTDVVTKNGNGDGRETWTPETAISEQDLQDPRIRRILKIIGEAQNVPRGWTKGKRRHIEAVALKYDTDFRSIYRWIKKYEKRGIAGLRHSKSTARQPKAWTPEAVDCWMGLCLKREHRNINFRDLYEDCLLLEARRRGWRVGTYESARWWYNHRINPQLLELQRGGMRALDNVLPPVLRDYSDLEPFEILVGDQHRFDFWVVGEETGEVYRPEAYLWQDLRTRVIYGAALDRRYDAWLVGLALRIGIRCYGAFKSIYTDSGRPELSRYLAQILGNLRALDMEWERTEDIPMEIFDVEGEDLDPHVTLPGTHRRAIVRNAKAKMIERTNGVLEEILASRFRLPGSVKRLTDGKEAQEVDHDEAMALARAGKLLTDREFALALYRACDYYNRERPHRAVVREWAWKPKPREATPWDCLRACCDTGWRPRMISDEATDLMFLAKESRIVDLGRIRFQGDLYEHDALLTLHKSRVDVRYNPMDLTEIYVFQSGRYLCTALPVEYSSMKDMGLARRKIEEKRARRKRFSEEFRKITSAVPDYREYSKVPQAERVAALIEDDRKKRAEENSELNRIPTQEELDAGMARLEAGLPPQPKRRKPLPTRPSYFLGDYSRYEWTIKYLIAGGNLTDEDRTWKESHEAKMTPDQLGYWKTVQEYGDL